MSGISIETKNRRIEFGVCDMPYRKSKALYMTRGAMTYPVAYFRNDENAAEFQKAIDFLLEAWQTIAQQPKG